MSQELPPAFVLGVLSLLYAVAVSIAISRNLWFDELITYRIAQLPTLAEMWRATLRWDLNPPLFHLLAWSALHASGGKILAVRLPSVIEYYLAGVFLFLYARRKIGVSFGALAVVLLWYGPMSQYATEARPYAALCFWFCALLLLWDAAVQRQNRSGTLVLIAFCSVGLLASHVFGTLTLFAFFCAELVRWLRRRSTDWPLWIALFGPLVLTAFYAPLVASYSRISEYPPAFQASPRKIASFYWHNFAGVALCLAAMAAAAMSMRRNKAELEVEPAPKSLALPEIALFGVQAVLPILLTVIFMIQHGAFWGRYCITSVVALYFLAAYGLGRLFRTTRAGQAAFYVGVAMLFLHAILWPWWQTGAHPVPHNAAALENVKPNLPLAVASGLTFVEMGAYESPRLLSRLVYLQDRAAAMRIAHASMFNDLDEFQRSFHLPGRVVRYAQFTREHNDFLVLATPGYPEDWLLQKLAEDGAEITSLGTYRLPYKDKQLFEVHLRAKA